MSYYKSKLTPDMLEFVKKHYFDDKDAVLPDVVIYHHSKEWLVLGRKDEVYNYKLYFNKLGLPSTLEQESIK